MTWNAHNPSAFRARLCPPSTVPASAAVKAAQATGARVRCVVGAVGCGVACFALLCFLLQLLTGPYETQSRYGVCATPSCTTYSHLLTAALNEDVNPCEDFDLFVCGRWRRSHHSTSVLYKAVDHLIDLIGNELRAARHSFVASSSKQTALDKAAAFYVSCVRVVEGPYDELGVMRSFFHHADVTWPRPSRAGDDLLYMLMHLSLITGFSPLFNFYVTPSAEGKQLVVEHADIFRDIFRKRRELIEQGIYWNYYSAFAEKLEEGAANLEQFAELANTEEWVVPWLLDAFRQPGDDLLARTLTDLNFTAFTERRFRSVLNKFLPVEDRQIASFRIRGPNVWNTFSKAVLTFGERGMYDCVAWWMIQYTAPWLNKDLAEVRFRGTSDVDVSRRCVILLDTLMGLVTWTTAATPSHVRSDVYIMIQSVRDAMSLKTSRTKVQFLSAEELRVLDYRNFPGLTRSMSYNLLATFKTRSRTHSAGPWTVSYLQRALDTPGDILHDGNLLLLPYLLSAPVFENEATAGVNYGALGSLISAALLREAASDARVQEALACYRRHEPALVDETWRAAAVDLTWQASSTGRIDTRLEGLSEHSGSKTFFILWCFISCSTSQAGLCNAALRRSGQFATTFRCDSKDRMNPPEKCALPVM